jgi:carbon monoxide dehydrogenase subunit G
MAFEIARTFVIKAPPAQVWDFLTDPERVVRCLPGAAITGRIDEKTWSGTMTVKVGPVSSSYKGKVVFEKLDAQARNAEIVATGQDVRGKGGADLRLTSNLKEAAPGQTEVTTVSRVNITGILAQMGRGIVQDVSDQMFQVFAERMQSELESATPPQAPQQAMDLGAIGARAAARRPEIWIAAAAVAVVILYLLLR